MQEAQAEALSHIFAEMAPKNDLRLLQERIDQRFAAFDERLEASHCNRRPTLVTGVQKETGDGKTRI